jgi:DNA primase
LIKKRGETRVAFSESFLTELVERNDIVDVVSEYVHLGKRSGSNIFGLCPFHNEKTPSFSVSPDKQIYHCFGCGKGGGVINFIMEIENLTFPEAVEKLARRAGMPMPEQQYDAEGKKKARILALNKDAANFFYSQLSTPAGKAACEYMVKRQISPATAKKFGLGCAPDSWNSMVDAMRQKGYSDSDLLEAGLAKRSEKNKGIYDTFRNRLMFPVIDVTGKVIGFSGRILGDGEPKYLNSRETAVFSKSRNLFAMNLAKNSKSGYIILTEGNVDVVSLHQAGFDSAVASLGTSLTREQASLISRYTSQVIIAYDNDNAGIKASKRAIEIFEKLDVKVKILSMSGAKDPDEFIKQNGAGAFRNLIEASEDQADYRLNSVKAKYDLSLPDQKAAFLKEATRLVASFPGTIEREVYAKRVAELASVDGNVIAGEVKRVRKSLTSKTEKDEQKSLLRPEQMMQPADKQLRYDNPTSAVAEEGVIRLLYLEPELISAPLPSEDDFSSDVLRHIYSVICTMLKEQRTVSPATLAGEFSAEEMSLFVAITQKPENLSDSRQTMADYVKRIKTEKEQRSGKPDFNAIIRAKQNTAYDKAKK